MNVRFVAERGAKGEDNIIVDLTGLKDLPKYVVITAEDYQTPIATGKVFIDGDVLKVEADLREQEFNHYPTIGFESIHETEVDGNIIILESELHTVSLQPNPNSDPGVKTISEQIELGIAEML